MLRLNICSWIGMACKKYIQIQPMLRLNKVAYLHYQRVPLYSNTTNVKVKLLFPDTRLYGKGNSNTTNVKVKSASICAGRRINGHSNTTNVKVKYGNTVNYVKFAEDSNTTNVKVKSRSIEY